MVGAGRKLLEVNGLSMAYILFSSTNMISSRFRSLLPSISLGMLRIRHLRPLFRTHCRRFHMYLTSMCLWKVSVCMIVDR